MKAPEKEEVLSRACSRSSSLSLDHTQHAGGATRQNALFYQRQANPLLLKQYHQRQLDVFDSERLQSNFLTGKVTPRITSAGKARWCAVCREYELCTAKF
jgi:hypothetical protein